MKTYIYTHTHTKLMSVEAVLITVEYWKNHKFL